mmetsp:Transcript_82515/g.145640  ORF Transcript_82515/g.145640 Transcript_82515/m.145640 type:complete len:398 (+) Transcript_82515:83-1276(+)
MASRHELLAEEAPEAPEEELSEAELIEEHSSGRLAKLRMAVPILLVLALLAGLSRSSNLRRGSMEIMGASHLRSMLSDVSADSGIVDGGIYTFGAPATAIPALPNLRREDRCFGGLRSWTENVLGPMTRQEDGAAISNQFHHAKMASVRLHWNNDSDYVPCPGETSQPFSAGNEFANWNLHWEDQYTPRLINVSINKTSFLSKEPFASAYGYVRVAYKQYDSTVHAREDIAKRLGSNWKVVARETLISGAGSMYDEDPVMIVQDHFTLDCIIAFAGINNYGNELAAATTITPSEFCGFQGVHIGFRDELRKITTALFPNLRPKLSRCKRLTCTGHSMGGSLCELFSACVNSQHSTNADFNLMNWTKLPPQILPEITEGNSTYAAGAEHRCKEPPCPK